MKRFRGNVAYEPSREGARFTVTLVNV
jgi:hypothetical protein